MNESFEPFGHHLEETGLALIPGVDEYEIVK
jgi:hypothetical protein